MKGKLYISAREAGAGIILTRQYPWVQQVCASIHQTLKRSHAKEYP
jgi:hypothetical protein